MSGSKKDKLIGFKAFYGHDDDILDWWENIPPGERSHILRNLIRAYLGGEIIITPEGEETIEFSSSIQLARVQADTAWIRDAILEIPDYLDDLINRKMRMVQAVSASQMQGGDATSGEEVSEEDAQKRAERIKNVTW